MFAEGLLGQAKLKMSEQMTKYALFHFFRLLFLETFSTNALKKFGQLIQNLLHYRVSLMYLLNTTMMVAVFYACFSINRILRYYRTYNCINTFELDVVQLWSKSMNGIKGHRYTHHKWIPFLFDSLVLVVVLLLYSYPYSNSTWYHFQRGCKISINEIIKK